MRTIKLKAATFDDFEEALGPELRFVDARLDGAVGPYQHLVLSCPLTKRRIVFVREPENVRPLASLAE